MALRCVYTDLDGTLLGHAGSLLRDPEGNFSHAQVRALEACHRAGVEVVIKSGRREAQVLEDARLIGQTAYIFEAGAGVTIDGERTLLAGELADGEGTVVERVTAAGVPDLLLERYAGRLEYHSPWHTDRELSHLFRGLLDVEEANALLAEHGHEALKLIDNGVISRRMEGIDHAHVYHLLPREASKLRAVGFHMQVRGYAPEECIAVGDSAEDIACAEVVGRYFVVANGPARDPGVREAIAARDNVTVTEGAMGDGFYEAVISSLAGS